MKKLATLLLVGLLSTAVQAQKIDFNKGGRPEAEGLEPGYLPWVVNESETATETFDGITITLSCDPSYAGETIMSNYWKQGVTNGAKLVGDGVIAYKTDHANITAGAVKLDVSISGLPSGRHSLQAFHNNIDGLDAPILDVYVNGVIQMEGVEQTNRQTTASASGQSYVEFDVVDGETVVVSYVSRPEAAKSYGTTTVTINALVFNEADNRKVALDPYPAKGDLHADADDGSLTLSWKSGEAAVLHHVYFGESADGLAEVAQTTASQYALQGLDNHHLYYWRVDEEDASGENHKGEVWTFRPRHLAFPGAEGYGRYATGGRGGAVYHVTTLEDDPDNPSYGSLRYGLTRMAGPRTIVFDVGGTIHLKSRLTCSDDFVTIAGQTAPGEGILLRGSALGIGSEGIARYLRLYLGGGDDWDGHSANPHTSDGIGAAGANHTIIDHCSIAWTIDEGFSSRGAKNLTLQHTLIGEALNYCGHSHYVEQDGRYVEHGYAATIGGGEMEGAVGTYHHNLLVHNEGRNWSMSGGLDGGGFFDGHHDMFNNVCYNWGNRTTDGGTHEGQFVNNYYKMGPASTNRYIFTADLENVGMGTQSYYLSGNIRENKDGSKSPDKLNDTYRMRIYDGKTVDWDVFRTEPFFPSYATIESAEAAFRNVLSDAGCNLPVMLNHDCRMVLETLNGTTSTTGYYTNKKGLIDREMDAEGFDGLDINPSQRGDGWDTDGDGLPDWFEALKGTDASVANNNSDPDGDGYTDLEDYLNWMAAPHFIMEDNLEIDLLPYFAGYLHPVFSVDSISNNLTGQLTEGRLIVSATSEAPSLSTIDIKAEQDGVSLTRTFHIACLLGQNAIMNAELSTAASERFYDLNGRSSLHPHKGVNIHKGKKIIYK